LITVPRKPNVFVALREILFIIHCTAINKEMPEPHQLYTTVPWRREKNNDL
jgi:hypothetical protein